MRTHLPVILLAMVSLSASAFAGDAPPAASARLTNAQRTDIAVKHVTDTLTGAGTAGGKSWIPSNQELVVRPAIVSPSGNPMNPITGDGPIVIYAKQFLKSGTKTQKELHKLSPYANRRFIVNVCANGEACTLDKESLAPQAKLKRTIQNAIPVAAIVNDVVSSDKLKEAVVAFGGGAGLAAFHPLLGGGMIVAGAQTILSARKTQAQKREVALQTTITWAHDTKKQTGAYPLLKQTYDRYAADLQKVSPGATPVDILEFSKQLYINNL